MILSEALDAVDRVKVLEAELQHMQNNKAMMQQYGEMKAAEADKLRAALQKIVDDPFCDTPAKIIALEGLR